MNPLLSPAGAAVLPIRSGSSFQVYRSQAEPTYHQLSLEDAQGHLAHWLIPHSLRHLAKQPVLVWLLPTPCTVGAASCIDAGSMQLAPAHPGAPPDLRADLTEGVLRLNFNGQQLRGYYRCQCLPEGGGQLWQLIPIGHV